MRKPMVVKSLGALVAILGITEANALGAELESALQYPLPSVGEDAQPPSPAKTAPQLVSPRRIELASAGQRATRHTTISDPSANLGTWSTAGDRKRTLVASRS